MTDIKLPPKPEPPKTHPLLFGTDRRWTDDDLDAYARAAVALNAIPEPTAAPTAAQAEAVAEYAPGQWWLKELAYLWGGATEDGYVPTDPLDVRRAAKVACNFADAVFSGSRALAATAQATLQTVEPAPRERCRNCDDSGFVSSITGEYHGRCHCEAGRTAPPMFATSPAPSASASPVAWIDPETLARVTPGGIVPATLVGKMTNRFTTPIYAAPQALPVSGEAREPLTNDEIQFLREKAMQSVWGDKEQAIYLARAIEAAHGIAAPTTNQEAK